MRKIDLLSSPPKTFIFQKGSNKTTFGGFLTIMCAIAVFILAFTYIYNYVVNDKYIISYINYEIPIFPENRSKLITDDNYNPTLFFWFDLVDMFGNPLSKNFYLMDRNTNSLLERNKTYYYRVTDLDIVVIYNCSDITCSLQPEDKNYEESLFYNFKISYQTFTLDLQNKEKPLSKDNIYGIKEYVMNQDVAQSITDQWQIITIKEEKGLFDNFIKNKKDLIGGSFYRTEFGNIRSIPINTTSSQQYNFSGIYKPIFNYRTENTFTNYVEYSRKKITEFSLIANIFSLASAILNGLSSGFNFLYSEKFDSYEVIDKILSSKRKSKQKKINETKTDKTFPLLNVNEMKYVEIEEKEDEKDENKTDKIIEIEENKDSLPKYNIFSFIGNFFYWKCCKKNKVQESIDICNNILKKYYSIENLVYNQFMLENLLKDYKWNNPDLNSVKNIELIYQLKQMIKTDGILQ